MKLTIGMAVYDDFRGAKWTLSLLGKRMDTELIVVDNNPDSQKGAELREWLKAWRGDVKYVPFPEPKGTAAPRDEVFRQAEGDLVLCVDCHISLLPGSLDALLSHPLGDDLLQGPLVYDDLASTATHFSDVWRSGMWGTWDRDDRVAGDEPFEIGAQGLGLFACRRDAWPGFNPEFREFGGEEWYIHEKFRSLGRRCLCLPKLRWWHDFGRAPGVRYPSDPVAKIRNYIAGHRELGLPLDRARRHFVEGLNEDGSAWDKEGTLVRPMIGAAEWEAMAGDPPPPPATRPAPRPVPRRIPVPAQEGGPGTELERLFASLRVRPKEECGCAWVKAQMDRLGVEGCRRSFWTVVGMLKDGAEKYSWRDRLRAGAMALATGLAFRVDWADPFPGLVEEAIRRAERVQTHEVQS